MANSLQEQLLKAGLVSEQRLKETRAVKRKERKQGKPGSADDGRDARAAAQRVYAEKVARDRELNRQRQEAAARRAAEHEIRQLIHTHRIVRANADIAYHFRDGDLLKRLYVNKEQQAKLVAGQLAIVRQDTFYELVPVEIAERLLARDPGLILVFNRDQGSAAPDPDDPYAAYLVPDDLMW
ncbi:DUF2058 domain-containing protein [Caldichromatium japonicum]|uniref:DUF2058 domain-containing protein n=1 Tax=Caldichromatium japonicum TaxID=2699430 RepID=A0A6G7VE80_9GAMM|nr:DUF2058 domain-containing protein [Caldichromatium japonicum]QIK38158.1 DUF2058 domain-containing protein [Caldichromatium japonicum]